MRYNRAPSVKCIILVYFSEMKKCVKIKGFYMYPHGREEIYESERGQKNIN